MATVFATGSTVAVTTMEYEPGGVHDLQALLDRLIPSAGDYEHNRLNHDTNSHAHLRAAVIGPSETIPVLDGRLALGTWQQVVLIDFDDRPAGGRDRAGPVVGLARSPRAWLFDAPSDEVTPARGRTCHPPRTASPSRRPGRYTHRSAPRSEPVSDAPREGTPFPKRCDGL